MNNSRLKNVAFALLCVLLLGSTVYAADDFFWSDSAPVPTCRDTRDGTRGTLGVVIGGDRPTGGSEVEVPTCEEAMQQRVLVVVNGMYLQTVTGTGAEPFIDSGRTMIPLRAIADAFEFAVEWEEGEQKITLTKDSQVIVIHIGKPEIIANGQTTYFDDAVPVIKNSRTFLPARRLAELLAIQVDWNDSTRTATFTTE